MDRNTHIQALRCVAALLVVVDHSLGVLVEGGVLPASLEVVFYSIGGIGVTTFFVISGQIMTGISYDDFGSPAKARTFAMKRVLRVVPVYWMGTLLAFAIYTLVPLSQHPTVTQLLKSLLFIPYSIDPAIYMQPVLGQGWTLNYEMFFYALFTLALIFPRRIALPSLFAGFALIVAAGSLLKPLADVSPATTIAAFFADPIILLFAAGMTIGVLRRTCPDLVRFEHPFQLACLLLAAQIAVVTVEAIPPRIPFPATLLDWVPGVLAVFVCTYGSRVEASSRFEAMSERLGDASYSIYIFHIFWITALAKAMPVTQASGIPFAIAALAGSAVAGLAIHRLIERPVTKYLRRQLSKRTSRHFATGSVSAEIAHECATEIQIGQRRLGSPSKVRRS